MRWGTSNQETQRLWFGGRGLFEVIMLPSQRQMVWEGNGRKVNVINKAQNWSDAGNWPQENQKTISFAPSR